MERMATSDEVRALEMMKSARTFADGAGDSKARERDSSEASWRISVNFSGERSLVASDAGTAGSCGVVRRMCVRGSRSFGMRGCILDAYVALV